VCKKYFFVIFKTILTSLAIYYYHAVSLN